MKINPYSYLAAAKLAYPYAGRDSAGESHLRDGAPTACGFWPVAHLRSVPRREEASEMTLHFTRLATLVYGDWNGWLCFVIHT